ncbi:hypothetical protein Pfo_031416, partial [Paulownia fortunei]
MHNSAMRYCSSGGVLVSRLAYADDCIIFTRAHARGVERIMDFLHHYEMVFGQLINKHKSCLILSRRTSGHRAQTIIQITGFQVAQFPLLILVPSYIRAEKKK